MSAVKLTISITDNATAPLRAFAVNVADLKPLMANLGEIAHASVIENFEVGGRPKWLPLAPATIKKKGHTKPLIASGVLKNITRKVTENSVLIGVPPAAKDYAAIQHFGGKAGRGHKVTIPARPYMLLQDEDLREIDDLVQTWPSRNEPSPSGRGQG